MKPSTNTPDTRRLHKGIDHKAAEAAAPKVDFGMVKSVDEINPKLGHLFVVGPTHVTYADKHNSNILDESVLRAVPCHRCKRPFEQHTYDRVAFVQFFHDVEQHLVAHWFKSMLDWCSIYDIDGFALIEGGTILADTPASLNRLHDEAMDWSEEADALLENNDESAALALFRRAYEQESYVAYHTNVEPSRSILFRSAAALANSAKLYAQVREAVTQGLAGTPPEEIRAELQELLDGLPKDEEKSND